MNRKSSFLKIFFKYLKIHKKFLVKSLNPLKFKVPKDFIQTKNGDGGKENNI